MPSGPQALAISTVVISPTKPMIICLPRAETEFSKKIFQFNNGLGFTIFLLILVFIMLPQLTLFIIRPVGSKFILFNLFKVTK